MTLHYYIREREGGHLLARYNAIDGSATFVPGRHRQYAQRFDLEEEAVARGIIAALGIACVLVTLSDAEVRRR